MRGVAASADTLAAISLLGPCRAHDHQSGHQATDRDDLRPTSQPLSRDPVKGHETGQTAAAKRFKKVENATAVIWKTLLIAEKTFRRLDAPELLADVASGLVYINGVHAVNRGEKKGAA